MAQITLNRWQTAFQDEVRERAYRHYYRRQDMWQLSMVMITFLLSLPYLTYVDYLFFDISPLFQGLVFMRVAFVAVVWAGGRLLRRIESLKAFDALIFLFTLWFLGMVLVINGTRPADQFQHTFLDILILLTVYLLVPNRLSFQVLAASSFSIGNILIIITVKEPLPLLTTNMLWVTYILINLLGAFISHQLQLSRRRMFAAWSSERELVQELQAALANIKQLKKLLPICAQCKKIRDDDGNWHQVEVYIREHVDTEFSHGLCPDCVQLLYPQLHKDKSV
ncbi:MAG: hypothetical protein H6660_17110 [Ardenticatenaceae bacterium]|nr:hypothetical protein [Ardenticatenaceae bacterium]